jgi:hypothetical protein
MVTVFFSYAHADEALRDELEKQLAVLKNQGLIDAWHDRRIVAGQAFGAEIDRNLETADIILLLLSADFLSSDYCYQHEATRALERHRAGTARVIPVILRPCDWRHSPFGSLLAAPRDGKPITKWADRDEAFLDVVNLIRTSVEQITGPRASPHAQPPMGASAVSVSRAGPRSSNVRLAKTFTDLDRDRFVEDVFGYVANYFENSLDELKSRNPTIETQFKRLDGRRLEASIYVGGKRRSVCGVWHGGNGLLGGDIFYSAAGISQGQNSWNESLSVGADDQGLYMKALGMAMGTATTNRERDKKLTSEGTAELLWSLLIRPLQ